MKYNKQKFDSSVSYYEKLLKGHIEDKLLFVMCDLSRENAFFSLAPLSRAVHALGGDMHVMVSSKESENYLLIKRAWHVYEDMNKGLKTEKTKALKTFITAVDRRTKTKVFRNIFKKPEILLYLA